MYDRSRKKRASYLRFANFGNGYISGCLSFVLPGESLKVMIRVTLISTWWRDNATMQCDEEFDKVDRALDR